MQEEPFKIFISELAIPIWNQLPVELYISTVIDNFTLLVEVRTVMANNNNNKYLLLFAI